MTQLRRTIHLGQAITLESLWQAPETSALFEFEARGITVSQVRSAIALEALVSAAFIPIGSKVGDLMGRKRACVLGLLGYAVGAIAMTLTQSIVPIIVFRAIIAC